MGGSGLVDLIGTITFIFGWNLVASAITLVKWCLDGASSQANRVCLYLRCRWMAVQRERAERMQQEAAKVR